MDVNKYSTCMGNISWMQGWLNIYESKNVMCPINGKKRTIWPFQQEGIQQDPEFQSKTTTNKIVNKSGTERTHLNMVKFIENEMAANPLQWSVVNFVAAGIRRWAFRHTWHLWLSRFKLASENMCGGILIRLTYVRGLTNSGSDLSLNGDSGLCKMDGVKGEHVCTDLPILDGRWWLHQAPTTPISPPSRTILLNCQTKQRLLAQVAFVQAFYHRNRERNSETY